MINKLIFVFVIVAGMLSFAAFVFAQDELGAENPEPQMQMLQPSSPPEAPYRPAAPPRRMPVSPAGLPASTPASTPVSGEGQIVSADSSGKITLELKGMDILDALKLLSKKSGLNIVAGKNVRGNITIYLKEVDVWDALRIILETNELAYEREGNIIKVMTARDYELTYGRKFNDKTELKIVNLKFAGAADLASALNQIKSTIGKVVVDEKSNTLILIDTPSKIADMQTLINQADVSTVTEVFTLNYTKAEDLEKKISEILTKGVGRIKIDTRTNKAVVSDTPKKMAEIEKIVEAFDEQHREVLIEAKIIQIILNDNFKMGVNWEYMLTQYHNLNLKSSFGILTDTDKKGKIAIGTANDQNDYFAFIEALNTIGTTNILSSPRIATVSNEEAKILVGSTEPYITTTTTTPSTGPVTTAETVNFIDVGVKLYVTPVINKDQFITMKIKPEVSSITGYLTTSINNKIPIKETSEAETNVMVKDGVTIIIGGLMKNEDLETLKKIPIFGDLPLIGSLFRSKDKTTKKTELIVMLTPHIISGDIDSYGASKAVSYGVKLPEPPQPLQSVPLTEKGISIGAPLSAAPSMNYEQYCQNVKDKVYKYIEKNYPQDSLSGKVELSFILLSSGSLKGEPAADSTADSRLKELAIKSVKEAAPFGAFPKEAGRAEDTFYLAILYE